MGAEKAVPVLARLMVETFSRETGAFERLCLRFDAKTELTAYFALPIGTPRNDLIQPLKKYGITPPYRRPVEWFH